jgi:hypothetical protein
MPTTMSRICGWPSGPTTKHFRSAPMLMVPITDWTGTTSTGSELSSAKMVTSALMPGLSPSTGSSMATRVL